MTEPPPLLTGRFVRPETRGWVAGGRRPEGTLGASWGLAQTLAGPLCYRARTAGCPWETGRKERQNEGRDILWVGRDNGRGTSRSPPPKPPRPAYVALGRPGSTLARRVTPDPRAAPRPHRFRQRGRVSSRVQMRVCGSCWEGGGRVGFPAREARTRTTGTRYTGTAASPTGPQEVIRDAREVLPRARRQ